MKRELKIVTTDEFSKENDRAVISIGDGEVLLNIWPVRTLPCPGAAPDEAYNRWRYGLIGYDYSVFPEQNFRTTEEAMSEGAKVATKLGIKIVAKAFDATIHNDGEINIQRAIPIE